MHLKHKFHHHIPLKYARRTSLQKPSCDVKQQQNVFYMVKMELG